MSVTPYNTGNIPEYRFYINVGYSSGVPTEVFPLNFLSSSLKDVLERDHVFYRREFIGSLLFGTNSKAVDVSGVEQNREDDWAFFWAIESTNPCEILYITITKTVGGIVDTYWEGFFSTTDGKFDIDKCTFEVTPKTYDQYTDILEKEEIEYNLLEKIDGTYVISEVITTAVAIAPIVATTAYNHNRFIYGADSVLSYLADKVKPGVNISSHFFSDATNYVTLDTNLLNYLTLAQRSDIIAPTATEPASILMISFKTMMDILYAMFQVTWNYDESTDTINFEHISWFDGVDGLDLRTQQLTQASNKYVYLKEEMPKYEKFAWLETDDSDFMGKNIWYDSGCVNQDSDSNIKEIKVPVTTDLLYIANNSTTLRLDEDGIVILCNYLSGGNYYVRQDFGRLTLEHYTWNTTLSWANLHDAYFRHNRVWITGYLNDILTTFWTAQKSKSQECSALICDMSLYNPEDKITTELGEVYLSGEKAHVKTAEIKPTGQVDFNLVYAPPSNINTGISTGFNIYGYFSIQSPMGDPDTISIQFYFNDPCPGNYNFRVREFVYDHLGVLVWTGAWVNDTWTLGSRFLIFSHTMEEGPLTAGWCIKLEIEYTGSEVDLLYIPPDPAAPSWSCTDYITYTVL